MESPRLFRLPAAVSSERAAATAELVAAVELVASGAARRVTIQGLDELEAVASVGLARARANGVAFAVMRDADGRAHVLVGPRLR
ncbi:MAG TPA: hypothetical protein VFS32_01680 [Candidatus Limnocylindrales bacterium]|nr:hypothetical protein [Candidatus Limnocylindrales bacterium]